MNLKNDAPWPTLFVGRQFCDNAAPFLMRWPRTEFSDPVFFLTDNFLVEVAATGSIAVHRMKVIVDILESVHWSEPPPLPNVRRVRL